MPEWDDLRRILHEHETARGGAPERYEILGELGRGATAVVYRARDRRLGREVALKLLREDRAIPPEAQERFRREAQAAARLSHPNLVAVHDAGGEGGTYYLVMELVGGAPLAAHFQDRRLPPRELAGLLESAARGIHHAHERGIVHRDLKPGNVIVSESGEPKIVDFGLVHLTAGAGDLTRAGSSLGTPSYMAPEQVEGRPEAITPRTDVYALGAILYEGLTGRPPHTGATLHETLMKVARGEIPTPIRLEPSTPPPLSHVAMKAMEREPSRRYVSALEFAEDLRRWLDGKGIVAAPPSAAERAVRAAGRHRRALAVGALVAAGGAALAAWGWSGRAEADAYRRAFQQGLESWSAIATLQGPATGRADEASAHFRRAAEADRRRPEPLLYLARCRILAQDPAGADAAWEESLRRAPGFGPALFERGRHRLSNYVRLRTPAPSRISGGRVIPARLAVETEEAKRWKAQGMEDLRAARASGALGPYERAVLEGLLALGEGRFAEGAGAVAAASDAAPWDAAAWSLRGLCAYHGGDFESAARHLSRAIALSPRPSWLRGRAHARFAAGRLDEAASDLAAALALAPEDADLHDDLGLVRQAQERWAEAEASHAAAVARRPGFARALNNRGAARAAQKNYEGAKRDFEAAITAAPRYAEAVANLGRVWWLQGEPEEAVYQYTSSLELEPDQPDVLAARGRAWHLLGRFDDAVADFRAAVKLDPADLESRYQLAHAMHAAGRRGEAVAELRALLSAAPESWPRRADSRRDLEAWDR